MCLGAIGPLIGGIVSAAGAMITAKEQEENARRQAEARNEKLSLTLRRNDPLAEQSRRLFEKRVAASKQDAIEQQQADAQENRTETIADTVADPGASAEDVPLSGSAPQVVKSAVAQKMLDVFQKGTDRAKALGKLGSYGDTWFDQGMQSADASRNVSLKNNFTAGNLAILPHQQDVAELRAYKPISPIGGILSGLGGAFGGGGGGGGGGGFYSRSYTSPI